jgi:hypothetical protein
LHDLNLAPAAGDSSGFSGSSSSNGLAAADAARRGQSRAGAGAAVAWRLLEDYRMEADLARWARSSSNSSSSAVRRVLDVCMAWSLCGSLLMVVEQSVMQCCSDVYTLHW